METWIDQIENLLSDVFGNIKFVEDAFLGLEGSYVELLTILALSPKKASSTNLMLPKTSVKRFSI